MTHYNNKYAQNIHTILSPLLGDNMAHSVLKKQTELLGVKPQDLEVTHVNLLSESIKNGLIVFLGSDKAQLISNRIKSIS